MGALHAGHGTLIRSASAMGPVLVSVFVNPLQFGPEEDLHRYPRSLESDLALAERWGAAALWAPSVEQIYPRGGESCLPTMQVPPALQQHLCGAVRPGHFDGVATVVARLLDLVRPHQLWLGEKDWQQLTVIRRLVRDLDISTKIISVATVRDEFGLALSSRNSYLDSSQLNIARKLSSILQMSAYNIASGGYSSVECAQAAQILLESGFEKIDYLECRNSHSLDLIERTTEDECRIFAAVYINNVRLIDNHVVV